MPTGTNPRRKDSVDKKSRDGSTGANNKRKRKNPSCLMCSEALQEGGAMVECEICDNVACFKCSKLPLLLREMAAQGTLAESNVTWMCNCCKAGLPKLSEISDNLKEMKSTNEERMTRLEETVAKMQQEMDQRIMDKIEAAKPTLTREIETKVNTKLTTTMNQKFAMEIPKITEEIEGTLTRNMEEIIARRVEEGIKRRAVEIAQSQPAKKTISPRTEKRMIEISVQEQGDRERRAPNLLIFKLPEPETIYRETMKKEDKESFIKICKAMNVTVTEDKIKDVRRIGEKKEKKHRGLMIELVDQEEVKGKIFKNMKNLKGTIYDTLTIQNDLTKMQRDNLDTLWDEAKDKTKQDQSGKQYYRVVGPPWNWQVKAFERKEMVEEEKDKVAQAMEIAPTTP